jgi:hypothetical protein
MLSCHTAIWAAAGSKTQERTVKRKGSDMIVKGDGKKTDLVCCATTRHPWLYSISRGVMPEAAIATNFFIWLQAKHQSAGLGVGTRSMSRYSFSGHWESVRESERNLKVKKCDYTFQLNVGRKSLTTLDQGEFNPLALRIGVRSGGSMCTIDVGK